MKRDYDSYLHFIIYKAYFIYHDEAICKKARRNSQFKRLADIGLNDSAGLRLDHVDLIRFIGVYMGGCDIHTDVFDSSLLYIPILSKKYKYHLCANYL